MLKLIFLSFLEHGKTEQKQQSSSLRKFHIKMLNFNTEFDCKREKNEKVVLPVSKRNKKKLI